MNLLNHNKFFPIRKAYISDGLGYFVFHYEDFVNSPILYDEYYSEISASMSSVIGRKKQVVLWQLWTRNRVLTSILQLRNKTAINYKKVKNGKPIICLKEYDITLDFSVSHSGNWLAIAYSFNRLCGIDIEIIDTVDNIESIVNRFSSSSEADEIQKLYGHDPLIGFYKWWTRKESVLKALGLGLGPGIKKFSTPIFEEDVTVDTSILTGGTDPINLMIRSDFVEKMVMISFCFSKIMDISAYYA